MAPPRVVVLVLNYNSGSALGPCLRSLQSTTYPNAKIVVLDNGSTDESLQSADEIGGDVHEFGQNLGYCAAYNRALDMFRSAGDFYLLSNADLIVPPPTIERMIDVARDDATVGFVGPVQRHAETRGLRSAGIRWRCGHLPKHARIGNEPIDAVEGAFVLVRRSVLEKVGGLDEAFGLHFEDVEWQTRAGRAGFRVVLAADAEILHRRPGTFRVTTGAYYEARNACILTAKYCNAMALRRVRLRLYAEGIASSIAGHPRGRSILEGLRDFRGGITGMKPFPHVAQPEDA